MAIATVDAHQSHSIRGYAGDRRRLPGWHASVSFTLDKYSHLMPDDDQQAAVAVAALVDKPVVSVVP